jgi:hypothetical protein
MQADAQTGDALPTLLRCRAKAYDTTQEALPHQAAPAGLQVRALWQTPQAVRPTARPRPA